MAMPVGILVAMAIVICAGVVLDDRVCGRRMRRTCLQLNGDVSDG